MIKKLLPIRRWGVAVLSGVTLLGAISILGTATASASTPVATATITSGSPATNLQPSDTTAQQVAGLTITLNQQNASATDKIAVELPCSTKLYFPALSGSGSSANFFATWGSTSLTSGSGLSVTSDNCSVNNEILLSANAVSEGETITIAGQGSGGPPVMTGAPSFTSPGGPTFASAGAVTFSGIYIPSTGSNTTFTTPQVATVTPYGVSANSPPISIAASATAAGISNVTFTEPYAGAIPASAYVCLILDAQNDSWGSTAPTVNATGFGLGTSNGPSAVTVFSQTAGDSVLSFQANLGTPSTSAVSYTLSGLTVNTGSTVGQGVINIVTSPTAGCYSAAYGSKATAPAGALAIAGPLVAFSELTESQPFQGVNADGTTALEFEGAFPTNPGPACKCVVLASDVDPFDALDASYLEAYLGTGILITPASLPLASSMVTALQNEGIATVYPVGGTLALPTAVLNAVAALPVYNWGGVSQASPAATITVEATLAGTLDDDTAQAINTKIGTSQVDSVDLVGAYSAATSTTGGGLWNDTLGNSTAAGSVPSGALKTAFLVSDTDFNDSMASAVLAYKAHVPVILTPAPTTAVPAPSIGTDASAEITALGIQQVIALGGNLALPNSVVTSVQGITVNGSPVAVLRVAGSDAGDTAHEIANLELGTGSTLTSFEDFGYSATVGLLTQGLAANDALGVAAYGGIAQGGTTIDPTITTQSPTSLGTTTTAFLNQAGNESSSTIGINGQILGTLTVLGGTLAMPASTVAAAEAALEAG